ncbi:hypothetical protein [Curtobacterium sp. MCBA15_008]|uniref:hypothetical protein n=1 Tax=Curtobacterium sp. MCBA15_008 TaxID=1898736 RepID=UPI0008DC6F4B|nr:hypothetical protein [Curtobacterium sp. MCBA15_008]OII11871.1 hypothetical protein BIU96_17255 [Curtobacterium sp. MCBA15_008]
MASHRLPDEERPRRAVPAWVTAPPEDGSVAPAADRVSDPGLEARPTPVGSAPAPETVGSATVFPAPQSAPSVVPDEFAAEGLVADGIVVPDYPPQEDLLPPAPTSPAVHTLPFDRALAAPAPVSPIDAAPPVPTTPAVPVVGQPRFSVPGLEHVVVEGTEPEPVGPIGYRTPARFAHQRQAASAPAPAQTRSFDAVIAPPGSSSAAAPAEAPTVLPATMPITTSATTATTAASGASAAGPATSTATAPAARVSRSGRGEPRLQSDDADGSHADPADAPGVTRRPAVGATPGAVLGAVAGLATLGLAAWWFTAPATVHGVGVALGAIALVLSIATLRNPATTWQRPIALLGAVIGGVGTLGLLWAVAAALLPMAGVTLPDLTGTGTTPTLAP